MAMEKESVEGAIAAAEYFMRLYPYIYASGEFTEWDAIVDEDRCENFCATARSGAVDLHAGGGYAVGGAVEVLSADGGGPYDDQEVDDVYIVELELSFESSEDVRSDGTREHYDGAERSARVALIWVDDRWRVIDAWNHEAES
ncbi:hypothetical protein IM660_11550 [Ruania alkalisoli]|uniref:DUF6318 domain-containing protein n=1 Tax=Ruania alkalisoli TaxID=2779775 RepID=A0A7M1SP34_9MICO|nr:DUF6318 family protein [Ruania alkalisoli]QOR69336.1 hypothetical protein IM660_11550 [Ruania alkalisoli]